MRKKEFAKTIRSKFCAKINIIDLAIKITYYQYRYNIEDLYYYDKKKKIWLTKLLPIIENAFKIRWWIDKNEKTFWDIFHYNISRQSLYYHLPKKVVTVDNIDFDTLTI
jgi:hypothetical protein